MTAEPAALPTRDPRLTSQNSKWTTIDRIISIEPGKGAVGVRNVPNTLSIFDSHFPRFHVLPGVLIVGSMAQLASILLHAGTGREWRLAGATQLRFRHFVQPGDEMEITVEIKSASNDEAVLTATAKVSGRPVTSARQLRMVPR